MSKNEVKSESLAVNFTRTDKGEFDVDAFIREARKVADAYLESDAIATAAVVKGVEEVVSSDKYTELKNFQASTLANLALNIMGELPTATKCAETETRVRAYLNGQDRFIHISRGRNAGYWLRDRLSKEEIAKLTKSEG